MLVEMQIEILDGRSSGLFSNETIEKNRRNARRNAIEILDGQISGLFSDEAFEMRPVMTVKDFVWHSDDHFESHLGGNGL